MIILTRTSDGVPRVSVSKSNLMPRSRYCKEKNTSLLSERGGSVEKAAKSRGLGPETISVSGEHILNWRSYADILNRGDRAAPHEHCI